MRTIENTIYIHAPVDKVFSWFTDLEKNYLKWHPSAHYEFVWLSDKPISIGTKFYFVEKVEGRNHKLFMEVSDYIENKKLSFVSESIYIESKILPEKVMHFLSSLFKIKIEMKREFKALSAHETSLYTRHQLGCHLPLIGKFVEIFLDLFIFSRKDHEKHMDEENQNMKMTLEPINTN